MKVPKLQIYKTRKGLYRWRLRGANGEIMCQGTSVKTRRACLYQIKKSIDYLMDWDESTGPVGTTRKVIDLIGRHVLDVEVLA